MVRIHAGEPRRLESITYRHDLTHCTSTRTMGHVSGDKKPTAVQAHTPKCPVHQSRIPRKNRRFFFDCECPIYIKGRTPTGDLVPRQSTSFQT